MLKEVLVIPEAPLDCIGATPRNNDMGKTFNPNDMHGPPKHKVSRNFWSSFLKFRKSLINPNFAPTVHDP